jgi:uncharacterized glyoxalase superfamily protein PhnB
MLSNRSMPRCAVIPELAYADVTRAAAWLCDAFGFTVRLRIADHRVQLNVNGCALVVTERGRASGGVEAMQSVMVRVEDANAHHARAVQHGVEVLRPPTDYPYGERQYTVRDIGGHVWTFSESIADVDPADWGGRLETQA